MPSNEGLQALSQEQTADVEAYAILQEKLRVSEAVARELVSVEVICPFKDSSGNYPTQSLGDFIVSKHAADTVGNILDVAKEEITSGETVDKAIRNALGASAVRMDKETGRLARIATPEPSPNKFSTETQQSEVTTPVAESVKKK